MPCFLVYDQGSLVGQCMQDYKPLCASVMICFTLVNMQTDTQTHTQTAFWPAYMKSSASFWLSYKAQTNLYWVTKLYWVWRGAINACASGFPDHIWSACDLDLWPLISFCLHLQNRQQQHIQINSNCHHLLDIWCSIITKWIFLPYLVWSRP